MLKLFKKLFIFWLTILLIFPFELNRTEAASTMLSKTVEYFIGQESAVKASGEYVNFPPFTINIPENINSSSVKSAIIEVNGVSYNDSGNQTITIDLERNADPAGTPAYITDHIVGVTAKPKSFKLQYDALKNGTGPMSDIISSGTPYVYSLYIKNTVSAGTLSFSIVSAKLILTYNSSSSGSDFLKTTKFFVGQETNNLSPNPSYAGKNFTLTIPEQSPAIQSVFMEIGGSAKGSGISNFQAGIVPQGTSETYSNSYTLNLGALNTNSKFLIRHNAFSEINFTESGSKNYTLYFKSDNFNIDIWNAKLIVTYKYTQSSGGLPPKGELISSTFDTGITAGAAYNSLMWKGSLNSGLVGQVGLQIAAAELPTGPWIFEGPGPGCDSSTKYMVEPNTPIPIDIACEAGHNNKKYFRYKVIICSNVDCSTSGNINPQVDEVVVNWSP